MLNVAVSKVGGRGDAILAQWACLCTQVAVTSLLWEIGDIVKAFEASEAAVARVSKIIYSGRSSQRFSADKTNCVGL